MLKKVVLCIISEWIPINHVVDELKQSSLQALQLYIHAKYKHSFPENTFKMPAAKWRLFYSDVNVLIHMTLSASALSLAKNVTITFLWGTWEAFTDEYLIAFVGVQHQYIILFHSFTLCGLETHIQHTSRSMPPVLSLLGVEFTHLIQGYSQTPGHSSDCPTADKATLKDMGKYWPQIYTKHEYIVCTVKFHIRRTKS